jgi:hypothetical protein
MITIPDWLILALVVTGAWFWISVAIATPLIIMRAVSRRRQRRHDAETVRRAAAAVVAEAERIANGQTS